MRTENEYAKGSNQIAFAVYDRLNKTDLTDVTHDRLVADGCVGQNKNLIMISMCMSWILEKRQIKKRTWCFPSQAILLCLLIEFSGILKKISEELR